MTNSSSPSPVKTQDAQNNGQNQAVDPKQKVVILGAGLASWNVIDAIRAKNKDITITLITADSADRYNKPMLSMAINQHKTAADLIRVTGIDACHTADVTLMAHTTVSLIDPVNNMVQTTEGAVSFDTLVIATGANPAIPASLVGSHHLNHINAFTKLQQSLVSEPAPKIIAVVGAGMVGTETAEDLYKAGHTVHLIDTHSAPLSSMLPVLACERIREAITAMGVIYHPNNLVSQMIKVDSGYQLTLDSTRKADIDSHNQHVSSTLIVDEVVACTGLSIDHALFTTAGITTHPQTGIVVNPATLQTNVSNIYAIGDCMSIEGVACRYVAPLRAQAAIIADEILGNAHKGYIHKAPMIRLKNKCISVMATGIPTAKPINGEWTVLSDETIKDGNGKKELKMALVANDTFIASVTVKDL